MNPVVLILVAFSCLYVATPVCAQSSPYVRIELTDGGHIAGQLDARSNARRVWLRFERGSVVLLRPIAGSRIRAMRPAQPPTAVTAKTFNARSDAERASDLLWER